MSLAFDQPRHSIPWAISGDGRVIGGAGYAVTELGPQIPFTVREDGALHVLALPSNHDRAQVRGLSLDGSIAVGYAQRGPNDLDATAIRWSADDVAHEIPLPYLSPYSQAWGASADGSSIVLTAASLTGTGDTFVWSQATGCVRLKSGFNDDPFAVTNGRAINPDGAIVAGWAMFEAGTHFAKWQDGEIFDLGAPDLGAPLIAARGYDLSADGSVVVGEAQLRVGGRFACVWTEQTGNILLQDYLGMNGVSLPSNVALLEACRAVSADGLTFAGIARLTDRNSIAFVARIPAVSTAAPVLGAFLLAPRPRRRGADRGVS